MVAETLPPPNSQLPPSATANPLRMAPHSGITGGIIVILRTLITLPIFLLWVVVGLYIWIPLLTRRITTYVFAVINSAITRNVLSVENAAINLEHSITFFTDGFILIAYSAGFTGRHLPEQRTLSKRRTVEELGLATIVWVAIWAIFGIVRLVIDSY